MKFNKETYINYDISKIINDFERCCSKGDIENAKWFYNTFSNDSNVISGIKNSKGLDNACLNGHLELAKWLYEIGLDLNWALRHGDEHFKFRVRCIKNDIPMAEWLCSVNNKYKITVEDGKIIDFDIDDPTMTENDRQYYLNKSTQNQTNDL